MTIPDAAIEAAAEAMNRIVPNSDGVLWEFEDTDPNTGEPIQPRPVTLKDAARAALSAAMPAIREALAQEVIRSGPVLNWELNFDGSTDNTRAAYVEAFRDAASIVRGGTL